MALTMAVTDHYMAFKRLRVTGTLTPSSTYPTGGDPIPQNYAIKSPSAPINMMFQQIPTYELQYVNGNMKVIVSATGLELAAGAYPAALQTALTFEATYHKFF